MSYRTSTRDARRTRATCMLALLAIFAAAAACGVCQAAAPAGRVAEAQHVLGCRSCLELRGVYAPPRPAAPREVLPAFRRWMRWWTERRGVWV